jgi:hypothetical protein
MSVILENKIKSFSPNLNLEKMRELYQSIYNTIKKMPLDEVKKTTYNLDNIKFANTETGGRRNATKKYLVKTKRRKTKKNKKSIKKRSRKHKRTRKIRGGVTPTHIRVTQELINPLIGTQEYEPQANLAPIQYNQQTVAPPEERECGICLGVLNEEDCGSQSEIFEHRVGTSDPHYFHVRCLTSWFKTKLPQTGAENIQFKCPTCKIDFNEDVLLQRFSNNPNIQTGESARQALINFLRENPQEGQRMLELVTRPDQDVERVLLCACFMGVACVITGIIGCATGSIGGSKKKRGGESSKQSEIFMILSETLKNELVNMTKWADDEDKNRINNFLKVLDEKMEEIKKRHV